MKRPKKDNFILQDIGIIAISILVAVILVKTNTLTDIINSTQNSGILGSFIAGAFFTSIFTTAPAIVALAGIAGKTSILLTAFFGAIGSVCGDLIIFRFIRDRLSEHLVVLIEHDSTWKRLRSLFKFRYFRWITFLMGGLVLASPFPDEIGISLLGFSKMRVKMFVVVSFIFNFLGIYAIGLLAHSI
jgi:hypothetical protein